MTDVSQNDTPPVDVISGDQTVSVDTDDNAPVSVDVVVDEVFVDVVSDQVSDVDIFVQGQGPIDATGSPDIIVEADAFGDLAGPPGPQGPPGPPGPQGEGMGVESLAFRHVQTMASDMWIINHPLPFRPNVTVIDSTGQEIWPGETQYVSSATVQLTFSSAVGGEAYLT
jgi:hypothetical protein